MPSDLSYFSGNPKLIEAIAGEISLQGPLSFARFMELALYHEGYGYYMTQAVEQDHSSRERIGWQGDFFTAPELSPILAKTLVRQVLEIDAQLGYPCPFTFIEMGCGNGSFAAEFLQYCQEVAPDVLARLRYVLVERSVHLQSVQASQIREAVGSGRESQTCWVSSVEELAGESVVGVMFSNELVDAFPVHRIRCDQDHLQEVLVDYEDGQFVERLGPMSSSRIEKYVSHHGVRLREGQTSELHIAAEQWMIHVARVLERGIVITVDYGHTGSDYYASERNNGTFLCYFRHAISTNPFERIGEQDMTAHVNFSALATTGEDHALQPLGFTNLVNWLMGLGVEEMIADQDPESKDIQALSQLLRPHGMGTTFKVLVQRKGLEPMALQGLRYRAFFDDVL